MHYDRKLSPAVMRVPPRERSRTPNDNSGRSSVPRGTAGGRSIWLYRNLDSADLSGRIDR